MDPADDPEREDEANTKYGIRPVPFQIADRYQASLVNSYFDVLVQYGDEYEVLGFRDLIEVKVQGEADLDVQLKNPEYDITRGIKKVLYGFQGGGSVFESITEPVKFTGYISADERLPEALRSLRPDLEAVLDTLASESTGLLTWEIVDPDEGDGEVALQIAADYGFQPMAASLFDLSTFYFYLTASDGDIVVQMPLPEALDQDGLRRGIEEGLKRFAAGLLKNVALSAPQGMPPYMQQQMPGMQQPQGNEFQGLRDVLSADFDVDTAALDDGTPPSAADVLMVVDPTSLSEQSVFAIDQFLMRGGTVVVAARQLPRHVDASGPVGDADPFGVGGLACPPRRHHRRVDGHGPAERRVPVASDAPSWRIPVSRTCACSTTRTFVDVRGEGLNQDVPFTSASRQVTMAWASPVDVDSAANTSRAVTTLLQSSPDSWRSASTDIMPTLGAEGGVAYAPEGDQQGEHLGGDARRPVRVLLRRVAASRRCARDGGRGQRRGRGVLG